MSTFRLLTFFYFLFTASFNAFPDLNTGDLEAGILISSLVCGFLPFLAALLLTSKEPNPINCILSPFFNVSVTTSTKAFRYSSDAFFAHPDLRGCHQWGKYLHRCPLGS